jgi:hypothetical protein
LGNPIEYGDQGIHFAGESDAKGDGWIEMATAEKKILKKKGIFNLSPKSLLFMNLILH